MLCKNIKKKRHIQEKSPFRRERRLAGLSQEKAAERLGISTRTLQKYERGKAQPRFDMVVRMAEIYGCDLYAFLCSRRAGGMTGYRYAPVRVRSFRPDCLNCTQENGHDGFDPRPRLVDTHLTHRVRGTSSVIK